METKQIKSKQKERIDEFERHGIKVEKCDYLGAIRVWAGEAEKLLKKLRKLKRLEERDRQRLLAIQRFNPSGLDGD